MILKITRFSRRNKITPMVQFVRFPESVSPQMGFRLLGNPSNGINIKRATVELVHPDQVTKTPKVYDRRVGRVLTAA